MWTACRRTSLSISCSLFWLPDWSGHVISLLEAGAAGVVPDATSLAPKLPDYDRRLLFDIAFESAAETSWEEAESCLEVLRRRKSEEELASVQRQIETCAGSGSGGDAEQLRALQERKLELRRRLQGAAP